jgi:hypothetical protein
MVTYNNNGRIVDTYKVEEFDQKWIDVIPDSVGEMLLDKVSCAMDYK